MGPEKPDKRWSRALHGWRLRGRSTEGVGGLERNWDAYPGFSQVAPSSGARSSTHPIQKFPVDPDDVELRIYPNPSLERESWADISN